MTEIPEHLRKRAEEARHRAAGGDTRFEPFQPKIPAHLLERAKVAREKGQKIAPLPDTPKPLLPFNHTTPTDYNLMVAQIRRVFNYGSVIGPADITPSERVLFTIQNPGTWAIIALIVIFGFLGWGFFLA